MCGGAEALADAGARTRLHAHTDTPARKMWRGGTIISIASSHVRADGRSIKSRSKASLLAGRIDYRQIAGRTTRTGPRRRAVTEAEGGGGVEAETQ